MRIDAHTHFFPTEYLRLLEERAPGVTAGVDSLGRRYLAKGDSRIFTLTPGMNDVELRLRAMDEVGVDVQVLSLTRLYLFEGPAQAEVARICNDAYARLRERHKRRFRCLASVPLSNPDAAAAELDRAVGGLGLDGAIVGTHVDGQPLDDERFAPFFRRADELGTPLFIHPVPPAASSIQMRGYALVPMVGFIFETSLAIARLVYSGFFDRYPRVRVLVPHLGGAAPYLAGRWDIGYEAYPECRERLAVPPTEHLKNLYYDTATAHPAALRCAAGVVGVRRILFGSDYPHAVGDPRRGLRAIADAGFSAEEEAAIMAGNAMEWLEGSR